MFFSFYSQPPVFAEIIDRSVAFVNNEVITLSEVNELGESLLERITRQAPPEQLQNALQQARMAVIEQIIDKKLLRREADKYNITVSEREIDNAIENIIARNKTSREELIKEINRMEISEEKYKEDLHDQILQSKLVNIAVHSKVVVTEEEIADYYNTNFAKEIGDGGYHILQIGVSYNHDQNSGSGENGGATAKEKIEQIRKQAMAGADFRKLAGEHSDLPSSAYGGDIGVFQKKEMAPFMDKAVSELEPGGISEIVETETGLQIFKLVSRQNGQSTSKIPLATVKEDIRETLYQQKSSELYENWIKDIRQQAYIRIL
jgi:peptidyl-prolyl cis-trans isomerase SurA